MKNKNITNCWNKVHFSFQKNGSSKLKAGLKVKIANEDEERFQQYSLLRLNVRHCSETRITTPISTLQIEFCTEMRHFRVETISIQRDYLVLHVNGANHNPFFISSIFITSWKKIWANRDAGRKFDWLK